MSTIFVLLVTFQKAQLEPEVFPIKVVTNYGDTVPTILDRFGRPILGPPTRAAA